MRSLFAILALLATTAVFAGNGWVPYTDGRVGGCAVDNHGNLYGCTAQPPPPPEAPAAPSRRQLDAAYRQGAEDARAQEEAAKLFQPAPPPRREAAPPPTPVSYEAPPPRVYAAPPAPINRAAEANRSAGIDSLVSDAGKKCTAAGRAWVCRGTSCACQ